MDESLAYSSSLTEGQSFKVSDIPLILYTEISSRFGIGEEESHFENGIFWRQRNLYHEIPLVGFKGTIGVQKYFERFFFRLWPFYLSEVTDSYNRDRPILQISAGPRPSVVWIYGSGNLMIEAINADLKFEDASLFNLSTRFAARFAAMIFFRASQIACDPRCVGERYWEVQ
jgi:hypothetical protein